MRKDTNNGSDKLTQALLLDRLDKLCAIDPKSDLRGGSPTHSLKPSLLKAAQMDWSMNTCVQRAATLLRPLG
jgi:hypothetical protein